MTCWKYEQEYGRCFRDLFCYDLKLDPDGCFSILVNHNHGRQPNSLVVLLREYGIDIIDQDQFQAKFFEMLEKFHGNGTIKPSTDKMETYDHWTYKKAGIKLPPLQSESDLLGERKDL